MPKVPNLADEVAALRAELDAFRASVAEEVRTKRLVVVDPDGNERIATTVSEKTTYLRVEAPAHGDGLVAGGHGDVSVSLWAAATGSENEDLGEAQVTCTTGDDSYAILSQTQRLEGNVVVERGRLELQQQRSHRDAENQLEKITWREVTVDDDGLNQFGLGGQVVPW